MCIRDRLLNCLRFSYERGQAPIKWITANHYSAFIRTCQSRKVSIVDLLGYVLLLRLLFYFCGQIYWLIGLCQNSLGLHADNALILAYIYTHCVSLLFTVLYSTCVSVLFCILLVWSCGLSYEYVMLCYVMHL